MGKLLAKLATIFGYLVAGLPILLVVFGIWSYQHKLDWQTKHPTIGTDPAHLRPYFAKLPDIEQCEWAEGLTRCNNALHPYKWRITGYIKFTPEAWARITAHATWVEMSLDEEKTGLSTTLLPMSPRRWYLAQTSMPELSVAERYTGYIQYERTNRIAWFHVVRAED